VAFLQDLGVSRGQSESVLQDGGVGKFSGCHGIAPAQEGVCLFGQFAERSCL